MIFDRRSTASRRQLVVLALATVAASLIAAAPLAANPGSLQPAGWDAALKLSELVDRNPDPKVVEVDLAARLADVEIGEGKRVSAWTYNGLLPGPLIRARVGDRLIVHFTNELAEPTTIHWHGVRVPIEMDGVPEISQPEVKKGETFTYDFVLRDAGLYWYHPHVMSAAQVGFGLYGALLVEDPNDGVGIADQLTLVLSDIGFSDKGVLDPADSGGSAGMVFGREGEHVLTNGHKHPVLHARAGAPQRWRVVNAAKSRFFWLDLEGQPFVIIGRDGGLQEYPEKSEAVLVTPGERVDLIVMPTGTPGSELILRSMLYNRGYGSVEFRSVEELLRISFTADAPLPPAPLPAIHRDIVPTSLDGATVLKLTLTLPPLEQLGHSEYQINGLPYWKAKPYHAELGETQIWEIKNDTKWDHPFHLHGFSFLALDDNGQPARPLAWKDTINVPIGMTRRFVVKFDERPGTWMFHCHILDHADGGMMGTVHVGPGAPAAHIHPKP